MKRLVCHTPIENPYGRNVEVGDELIIVNENEVGYIVTLDNGFAVFTKEPDELGKSYATWFVVAYDA